MVFAVGFAELLVSIFSDNPGYVRWGVLIMSRASLMAWALPVPVIVNALLQSLQFGGVSTLFTFVTQTLRLPVISCALFFTDKTNAERLFWAYPIHQGFAALIAIPFAIFAICRIWNMKTEEEEGVKRADDLTPDPSECV
jgi:Na+-driven multidrug efflux pump